MFWTKLLRIRYIMCENKIAYKIKCTGIKTYWFVCSSCCCLYTGWLKNTIILLPNKNGHYSVNVKAIWLNFYIKFMKVRYFVSPPPETILKIKNLPRNLSNWVCSEFKKISVVHKPLTLRAIKDVYFVYVVMMCIRALNISH